MSTAKPLTPLVRDDSTVVDVPKFDEKQIPPVWGDPKTIFLKQWREQLAEFWGTMMFVYLGTGSAIASIPIDGHMDASSVLAISCGFGFGLCTMVYATANISGGHLNPAVTIGIIVARKMPVLKGVMFMIWQCLGAIIGSLLIKATIPEEVSQKIKFGSTALALNSSYNAPIGSGFSLTIDVGQGMLIELCLTFLLVFTIFSTAGISHDKRYMGRFAPLSVGFAVLAGHLMGAPFTGPSMNPARSLGPAVVSGYWEDHWVYWVGPLVGGILAALIYKYFFITAEDQKLMEMRQ